MPNEFKIKNGLVVDQGPTVLSGSLSVVQGANIILNTGNSTLSRLGTASVDWRNRTLNNSVAGVALNWDTNRIYDTLGVGSIDWEGRKFWDSTAAESINYELRQLYNSVGDTILDYETGTFSGTATTATSVNPLIQDVQITGSLLLKDILQLAVRTTTPTPVEGMIIASGSAGASKVYYYNGTTWNALF